MKRFLPIFSLILLIPVFCSAQWEKQVGLNVIPLVAKSVEVVSEFTTHPGYGLTLNAGYTFGTDYIGIVTTDVDDGVRERSTSGFFAKAGGRVYPFSLGGRDRRMNFFTGMSLVLSQYNQTALKRELTNDFMLRPLEPVRSDGVVLFPALSLGFSHRLSQYLILDWGVQKAFVNRKDDYIGRKGKNYQPGAGGGESFDYLQGQLVLKYKF